MASSLFPSFFSRTKRKMSGPAVAILLDMEDPSASVSGGGGSGDMVSMSSKDECMRTVSGSKLVSSSLSGSKGSLDGNNSNSIYDDAVKKTKTRDTTGWFCALCRSVDMHEVAAFAFWKVLVVLIVVLAVANWIFFFKFVVEPDEPQRRLKNGTLWSMFTMSLLYFRSAVRAKCGEDVRMLADHAEIFIAVSLAMVFSTNIAFYLHAPSNVPLRDLGFMLIPEQAVDSKWRPLSDVLTAVMPVLGMLQTLFMTRENRCRVIATFFRVATVSYGLRMLTVSLTSLPGPAPHCRPGSDLYFPPTSWIDIVTRVGPMYGKFNSCGDLIFSGHMAYTNSALLLYLRTMDRHFARFSRLRWVAGMTFLIVLAALCISGRKHYTVDVMLGIMVSSLVFFHFEHSWVPMCIQHPHGSLPLTTKRASSSAVMYPFGMGADYVKPTRKSSTKVGGFQVFDDDSFQFQDSNNSTGDSGSGNESEQWLYRTAGEGQHTAVDFIC